MTEPFSYDVVDYPPYVHTQMHPSRLAAIARLHGLPAASPSSCRLLEVGCGDGLQLLTLAQSYPDSRFVGVDLSASAIARGEAMRARLGLDNLIFVAGDIQDWDAGSESFDYILAHGFWSWVPERARARLLDVCETLLGPAGIAYVSYNTLPGCHLRRMLWDILRFHSDGAASPEERVQRAIECMDLLEQGMLSHRRYSMVMAEEIRDLRERFNPSVLFHDDLAAINDPCTLSDFLQLAYRRGLGFLAEANYLEMSLKTVHEAVRPTLMGIAEQDLATKEQYLDFLTGRRFRQTLLCRSSAQPRPGPDAEVLRQLEVTSGLTADHEEPDEAGCMRFSRLDSHVSTDNPLLQHLLLACQAQARLPRRITTLVEEARDAISSPRTLGEDTATAEDFLLGAFQVGLVDLFCDAPKFSHSPGERPCVSPLARLQIELGYEHCVSLIPSTAKLDNALVRQLALLLDGSRDRTGIRQALAARMATIPTLQANRTDACRSETWWFEELATLEDGLSELGRLGLLLA